MDYLASEIPPCWAAKGRSSPPPAAKANSLVKCSRLQKAVTWHVIRFYPQLYRLAAATWTFYFHVRRLCPKILQIAYKARKCPQNRFSVRVENPARNTPQTILGPFLGFWKRFTRMCARVRALKLRKTPKIPPQALRSAPCGPRWALRIAAVAAVALLAAGENLALRWEYPRPRFRGNLRAAGPRSDSPRLQEIAAPLARRPGSENQKPGFMSSSSFVVGLYSSSQSFCRSAS